MISIQYKLWPGGIAPIKGSENAAGFDLALPRAVRLYPGTIETVSLAIGFAPMTQDCFIMLYPRSSMLSKHSLIIDSAIIDSDYRGPVHAVIYNPTMNHVILPKSMRIIQAIIQPYQPVNYIQVEELNRTVRDTQGLGSTG